MRGVDKDGLREGEGDVAAHDRAVDTRRKLGDARLRQARDELLHPPDALCCDGGVPRAVVVPEG